MSRIYTEAEKFLKDIEDARNIFCINPPVEDFSAYSFWSAPLGLLRVVSGLRKLNKNISFFDFLYFSETEESGAQSPEYRKDGRHSFYRREIEKPEAVSFVPRKYFRFGASDNDMRRVFSNIETKPDVILIASGMTYWYRTLISTVDVLRSCFPDVPVLVGGTAAKLMPSVFLKKGIDVFQSSLFPGENLVEVEDLINRYRTYPLSVVDGCPFDCPYCASSLICPELLFRNLPQQAELLQKWGEKTGFRDAAFYDDALLMNGGRHLEAFFRTAKLYNYRFHVPNGLHVREISEKTAKMLFENNVSPLRLGFETLSDRYDRKTSVKQLEEKLRTLLHAGYKQKEIGIYLLCGLPGQSVEEVEESIKIAEGAGGRPYLSEFSPVPGTSLAQEHKKESRLDFMKEPIYQNNTLSAYRSPVFTPEIMNRLKSQLQKIYRMQDKK